jgi:hypothetical protein
MERPISRRSRLSTRYRIRVSSQLDPAWSERFAGMTLSYDAGETILEGPVPDQAALHGLLSLIRDLGLTLIALERKP